ncbi:MAG: hypothetical protein U5N86_07935 [Planctomycetota bacterium]|nr:hypothetical protein [Planctomycetota bacterium]
MDFGVSGMVESEGMEVTLFGSFYDPADGESVTVGADYPMKEKDDDEDWEDWDWEAFPNGIPQHTLKNKDNYWPSIYFASA